MITINVPDSTNFSTFKKIFLGGSIDTENTPTWREDVLEALAETRSIIFNPVYDERTFTDVETQLEWEWSAIRNSDLVIFNLLNGHANTASMLEIMGAVNLDIPVIINIDASNPILHTIHVALDTISHHDVTIVHSFGEFIGEIRQFLSLYEEVKQSKGNQNG